MKRSNEKDQNYDDRLADFADRALSNQIENIASNVDDELRGLQETIMRLKHSMPHEPVSQTTLKRLKSDFVIRSRSIQMKERKQETPWMAFLNRMMQMEINPNIILTVGTMAVLIGVLMLAMFTANGQAGALTGTAGQGPQITGVSIVAGGIFLLIIVWITRRK